MRKKRKERVMERDEKEFGISVPAVHCAGQGNGRDLVALSAVPGYYFRGRTKNK